MKPIINVEDIKKYVGTGNGIEWLVVNRINNLEKMSCISKTDERYINHFINESS